MKISKKLVQSLSVVCCLAMMFVATFSEGFAQRKRQPLPLIRDAEIEGLLKDYTRPIFKAAGLRHDAIDVFIINRRDFNAFVAGSRMFINTGALTQSQTPNEIIGVIAHETGHVVSGHLALLRDRVEKGQILAVLGALAGGAAMALGGDGGRSAGSALALGSQQAVRRSILSYQRADEIAADRVGINLLNKTGQSSFGMVNTFKTLGKNRLFSSGGVDPYAQSHPLPRERIALIEGLAQSSKFAARKDPANLLLRHNMMRAKIAAYSGGAQEVRALFKRNLNSAPARYGDAIATYLAGAPNRAVPKIDKLIHEQPKNPYLYEIKGEMLLRSGKPKAAIAPFKKAIALDRFKSGLLRIQLGHAYLETGNPKLLEASIKELKAGISRDRNSSNGYGFLARAYANKGNQILAIAYTAEERFLQGNLKDAKRFAKRAQPKLKRGSPQWLRLQDILDYKPPRRRRR